MSAGTDPRIRYQRAIARAEDLPRSVRHVAVLIAAHLNAQLVGGVAMAALMLESGYSKPTVLRATRRLRADGWLHVVIPHRRGRATVYRADVPALFALDEVSDPTPQAVDEVSAVVPDRPAWAVDRAFEVSPGTPDRPLVVSPVTPQPGNEVSPGTPLVVRTEDVRTSGAVAAVVAALPAGMSAPAYRYRQPVEQRLAAGWSVDQLVAATRAVPKLPEVRNPVGFWATCVPMEPPAPAAAVEVSAAPPPRCTVYGHEHAPVTRAGECTACRSEALAATS